MVRLGIIGAGIMGERLLRAAEEQQAVRVGPVWDPAVEAAARATAGTGAQIAQSADAVIEGSDCVYIASPPGTHLPHARAVLTAGRAIFLEKPLATDIGDAGAFVCESAGARVAINFPFASSPAVERLAEWLAAVENGAPVRADIGVGFAVWPRGWQHAAASWLDGRVEGGFTREVVSHFLFLAGRLLGRLTLLSAHATFPDAERSERAVSASLIAGELPLRLVGAVGRTRADDTNSFTVHFPAGAVRLRDWATVERQTSAGEWVGDPAAIPHAEARPMVLRRQLEGVARMTRGEPHHLATVSEAFAVQEVVEAILRG